MPAFSLQSLKATFECVKNAMFKFFVGDLALQRYSLGSVCLQLTYSQKLIIIAVKIYLLGLIK